MSEQRLRTTTPTIDIYIKLAQYPILADRLRERMREELFHRGIIDKGQFDSEVRELSLASQRNEGLGDPYFEEDATTWLTRQERIRDFHTDALFASNLGSARLDALIQEVLDSRSSSAEQAAISFNPEIAPWEMLFRQGEIYERMRDKERERYSHHLQEIKVVLIRRLMSDQLPFIKVAKRVLTIQDLRRIYDSLIGTGKIGGKAAGMYLAWCFLRQLDERLGNNVFHIPDSYFIGTDVLYEFILMNKLERFINQKYRSVQEIRAEYPQILAEFLASALPDSLVTQIQDVLRSLGNSPLIVRSSSLLEDNFGFSFAGKYNSFFCPNQSSPEDNLKCVLDAIRKVYASTLNPDALLYRKKHQLIDYDERMAILLQRVTGRWCGRYFYPDIAGVGFSENPFCWTPEIRQGEGFLRVVTGLGTRAVERIEQDYPRLIPLSHPELRIEGHVEGQRTYAQRFMAVVDRETNSVVTVPAREAISPCSPLLEIIASLDTSEALLPIPPGMSLKPADEIVLTFNGLTQDEKFISLMREALQRLEDGYQGPVNLEFAVQIDALEPSPAEDGVHTAPPQRHYRLHILECRPSNDRQATGFDWEIEDVKANRRLFSVPTLLPSRIVQGIDFLVFIDPECYYDITDELRRRQIAHTITALNDLLPNDRFAVIGPGRWGSSDSRSTVPITYSDICNARMLIEVSPPYMPRPELAFGTEFFEEVKEAEIFVLGIQPTPEGGQIDWNFLRHSPNSLTDYVPWAGAWADCVRVLDLLAVVGSSLKVVIDDANEATAYFENGRPASDSLPPLGDELAE
jgi:hypothetical protein